LLPLMVVAGAGGQEQGRANFRDVFIGARVSGFVWGGEQPEGAAAAAAAAAAGGGEDLSRHWRVAVVMMLRCPE
jgi:hypothetical protein